jgi:hypothetical protein
MNKMSLQANKPAKLKLKSPKKPVLAHLKHKKTEMLERQERENKEATANNPQANLYDAYLQ